MILFPDPISYIITRNNSMATLPNNASISKSVKFVPGDPQSPYATEGDLTKPKIPVVSINYDEASDILNKFVNAKAVTRDFWYSLPLNTSVELNFKAKVEVHREEKAKTLRNVIGTITGRYEPTRYVIIGGHHDTWHEGASRPGIAHSVLMEIARALGYEHIHGWRPGIITIGSLMVNYFNGGN